MGGFISKEELAELEMEPVRNSVDLSHWQDGITAEDVGTVPSGYKYVITEITIQNLGAASVIDFYDCAKADQAEAKHKISVDAKGTDTTVVTGIKAIFATAISNIASVCAAAHNLKIHLGGYKVKA